MLIEKKDKQIENEYLNTGFVVQDISDKKSLDWIRNFYFKNIKKHFPQSMKLHQMIF